ncbi:mandelate racemase [Sphingomonas deserti]|uniref:Mandelate racemase n=2 Tax=Allosphingosinicella deserti TaxID=2116704 RepID=A0A2P7QME4_9SPHN|nr:mandelate racemase [Sphingomonas deserti]
MSAAIDSRNAPVITGFEFHEVVVPAKPGMINSDGLAKPLHMLPVAGQAAWSVQFDELPKLVMRMTLSNGIVALGEFYRDHDWARIEAICRGLLGTDIGALSLQALPLPLVREFDGFELAIWDGWAKTLGVPLYALLGGRVRDRVLCDAWSSHRTLDEVGPWVRAYQDQGYTSIKLKADLEDDAVGLCERVAAHAPGMKVIFDPNQRWENMASVKPLIRGLEKVGNVLLLEDPIPKWMIPDYADLCRFSSIPIVQHVALPYIYQGQRVHDIIALIQQRAADGFNFNAGLAKFAQLNAIAEAANLYCFHGSEVDLGILEAMYLHQAVAAKSCIWPSDIFGRMIREHDLLATPLRFEPPYAFVPEGPGLGVELDPAAIERYSVRHEVFA